MKNIVVVGAGYVGSSISCLLGQVHEVTVVEIDKKKTELINANKSPIEDSLIEDYLSSGKSKLKAKNELIDSLKGTDIFILCLPTNYDPDLNHFDTSILDKVINDICSHHPKSTIIIKSTIPVGYTESIASEYPETDIIFSPEFLREGTALEDNIQPDRIIVSGRNNQKISEIAELFKSLADNDPPVYLTNSNEAESIKLFSNTYLALRVSFFNELDSFAHNKGLSSKNIIEGVCLDKRINSHYNNPSFGYGGYCLPKDTKQLLSNYDNVPQNLISGIVSANSTRKDYIADCIVKMKPKSVGIYRLVMKEGSDNIRDSSIQGVLKRLKAKGLLTYIYEPLLNKNDFFGSKVISSLKEFKNKSSLIITNRNHSDLDDVKNKVFTRDIFNVG